jgi:hypothetical protein
MDSKDFFLYFPHLNILISGGEKDWGEEKESQENMTEI